ncbi:branched-chain amino acid ABC transporter ATPase [Pseudonocardia sulfidoxydans NBRC 16205]|uniref:Branched-chain amino acid ABC transporter ATPase n=1 Tax=Pseudonocardia sulfidoxydans NBRC 16205 TaxID=1223511 RepID=A0A511DSX3_9PSEU|nr:ATP-binding cassette domain-containing protein [Pseudonocardia sulfidoxydans]GEL26168.1 branched-chain amino acid ABC transporter ATPase [Pseudonocardia sulfidoxydans NBRC 16205]
MADRTTLSARGLAVAFGALRAVDGVDVEVAEGQCVGVVGANGAGKSTLLNLLSGAVRPDAGTVTVVENGRSHRLDGAPGRARARLGIVRMFQTARLVPDLSARENVELGVPAPRGAWLEALGLPTSRRRADARRRAAEDALARVGLADRAGIAAGELSLGQQRLVEMARSLASGARILLLDEPFSGLSRTAREVVASLIASLRDEGVGVLLVEHDLAQVRLLADRVVVLDAGRVLAAGPVEETLADPEVVRRYIGDIELEIGGGLDDARPAPPVVAVPVPAPLDPAPRPPVLQVRDLRVFYGAVPAVDGVDLAVAAGDGLGIVGPNGAGKSTVLRGVAGLLTATGSVRLAGERLDGTATPHRFRHGLGFVPQTLTAVVDLSVEENLRLGWLAGSRAQSFAEAMERVGDLFGEIAGRRKDPAGALSGGQRQMLAIARALVAGPRVVLLDEPTAGLAPVLVAPFADALTRLRADGVAVVVVEHNLGLVRATCSTILGLRAGAPVWSGPTERFDGAAAHEVFLAATAPARTGPSPIEPSPIEPSPIEEEHLSS